MSIETKGNSILVDASPDGAAQENSTDKGSMLAAWVSSKVGPWEDFRNNNYNPKWAEYWRLWRGHHAPADKNRQSERSRIVSPALAQAIEMTVAEIEEALLSREQWIDIADDIKDEDRLDAILARDQLLEDLDMCNAKDTVSEFAFNAALFGTGILMINTSVVDDKTLTRDKDTLAVVAQSEERAVVSWEAVRPDEFIPDPSATCIEDMLGCARKVVRPMHSILEKIEEGIYRKEALNTLAPADPEKHGHSADADTDAQASQTLTKYGSDTVEIIEYHGKIPMLLLDALNSSGNDSVLDSLLLDDVRTDTANNGTDGPLVEAIVTVGNGGVLLRAMANPFAMTDRSVVAAQFEKVPGRFWGRGVAEKGYNPQKALDAEMRARIDALGYVSSPMVGVDSGRIPRGFKMEVKPGKVWLTNGSPDEVIRPVQIGNLQPNTFNQTSELMQMVQMGTGAFDTAKPLGSSASGGSGATSNSTMLGAYVKRAKRAVQNIDRNMLQPAIRKTLWRYMQFDPVRYPTDTKFKVNSGLGIIAREVEQLGLTQLMAMLPEEYPQVGLAVAEGIIDMSSVTNKAKIIKAVEAALAPPSPEQQQRAKELEDLNFAAQKAQAESSLIDNQKTIAQIREIESEAAVQEKRSEFEGRKVGVEESRVFLQAAEIRTFAKQNEIAERRTELQEKALEHKIRTSS